MGAGTSSLGGWGGGLDSSEDGWGGGGSDYSGSGWDGGYSETGFNSDGWGGDVSGAFAPVAAAPGGAGSTIRVFGGPGRVEEIRFR